MFDLVVTNSTESVAVVRGLNLVVLDIWAYGGGEGGGTWLPKAAIKVSGTFRINLPEDIFGMADEAIGIDVNPPLAINNTHPLRIQVLVVNPRLEQSFNLYARLELVTSDGRKFDSPPFVVFIP
ncbi:hypothetical protein [Paraburkholderia sp. BL18I3N2]|uniref:hypothetical protein n=1 Tax=Paraburkholderia sp. BL18I3N2 TaxID=1938799 RepID=UPI0011B277C0|nr:hypothetical protein [Paraburkholderia sp. BL18I3N2]